MRHHLAPLAAAWAVLALPIVARPALAEHTVDFKVVVPSDHPLTSIAREDLARVFLLEVETWEDGTPAAPVDRDLESPVREAFTRAIHGRSVTSMRSFWQRRVYAGGETPPPVALSDEAVLAFLLREPGAVGYVSAVTPLDSRYRVLDVPDLAGYDTAALPPRSRRPAGAEAEDLTVARHGELRLFLTGACGAGDEGRLAMLENRHPDERVEATIETSVWDEGRFRSAGRAFEAGRRPASCGTVGRLTAHSGWPGHFSSACSVILRPTRAAGHARPKPPLVASRSPRGRREHDPAACSAMAESPPPYG